VRAWSDAATEAAIPSPDGTLGTAQAIAEVLARRAKADNTRCAWCASHDLTPLPARPADVAAFLASQRYVPAGMVEKLLATTTLKLRLAAIAYLHYLAGLPPPPPTRSPRPMPGSTGSPRGWRWTAAEAGGENLWLREILPPITDDLPELRAGAAAGRLRRRGPPQRARITVGAGESLTVHTPERSDRLAQDR
jgi:hypothetical protein